MKTIKNSKKTRIIVPALLSILGCTAVVAGATYALFTSESKVNVAITSGKVDVKASIDGLEAYSPTSISSDGSIADETNIANNDGEEKLFANGGSASLEGETLTLSKVTPGDKATFNINITNDSNVKVLYRIIIGCESDDGLFKGLDVNFVDASDMEFTQSVPGITSISKYVQLEPGSETKTIKMSVELPANAGNAYKDKACSIACRVEAVQGNAAATDVAEGTLELYSATDLVSYGKLEKECVDADSALYNYTTIALMNDVDMNGIEWTPIIMRNNIGGQEVYKGTITFEGNGHTISNINAGEIFSSNLYYSGFFGIATNAAIQNVTIENANITSTHYAGGIAGQLLYNSKVENCKVINSTIVSTPEDYDKDGEYDNGDKVGGIVGHCESNGASISNCVIENTTVTAYRDLGGIVGYAGGDLSVANNTLKDVTITSDHTHNYKNYTSVDSFNVHEIIGRKGSNYKGTETDNTQTNVTVNNTL